MIEKKRNGTKGNEQNEDPANDKGKNPHNVDFRHGHVFEYQMVQYHRYNERDAANKVVGMITINDLFMKLFRKKRSISVNDNKNDDNLVIS